MYRLQVWILFNHVYFCTFYLQVDNLNCSLMSFDFISKVFIDTNNLLKIFKKISIWRSDFLHSSPSHQIWVKSLVKCHTVVLVSLLFRRVELERVFLNFFLLSCDILLGFVEIIIWLGRKCPLFFCFFLGRMGETTSRCV